MNPTTLRVTSTVLLRWIRDHSGEDFQPSMVVIANDWTTRIVWAQLDTLSRLGYIAYFPVPDPFRVRHYKLTAHGMYYLKALEDPDQARSWSYRYEARKTPDVYRPRLWLSLRRFPHGRKRSLTSAWSGSYCETSGEEQRKHGRGGTSSGARC